MVDADADADATLTLLPGIRLVSISADVVVVVGIILDAAVNGALQV